MKVHEVRPLPEGVQVTVFDEGSKMYFAAIAATESEAAAIAGAEAERYAAAPPWLRIARLGYHHEIGGLDLVVTAVNDTDRTVTLALVGGPLYSYLHPQETVDPMR